MKSNNIINNKRLWFVIVASGLIGLMASFLQTIERINYAIDPKVILSCDINSIIGCSSVFDAWQSSVFGFSNSLMCMVFFGFLLAVGLAGLTGSIINKYYRLTIHFASIFFLGFGAWYLQQSAFDIKTICIFCIFCYGAVILSNWAQFRLNYYDINWINKYKDRISASISKGADTFFWILWVILIAAMVIVGVR